MSKRKIEIAKRALDIVGNFFNDGLICSANMSNRKNTLTVNIVGVVTSTPKGEKYIKLKEPLPVYSESFAD